MKHRLIKSEFGRNITTLVSATAIAQVIPVLLQLYLRRVIPEEIYGVFAVYLVLTSILVVISTLRYEMAIVLPLRDKDAVNVAALSLLITILFNVLIFFTIVFFRKGLTALIGWDERYANWLFAVPIGALVYSSYQVINYWLIRKKAFRASASNKISRRVSEGILQGASGLAAWPTGLLVGELFGRIVMLLSGIRQSVRKGFTLKHVRTSRIQDVAKRYREFPGYQALPALLNTASLMIPVLIVNSFYGERITAQFDLSRQVLVLPLALISTAMSQVLFQKFSEKKNRKLPVISNLTKTTGFLLLLSLPVMVLLFFFGEPLFGFVFGKTYTTAGLYASTLVFAYMMQFVVSPVSVLMIALEKIKIAALWQVCYFCAIVSLFFFKTMPVEQFIIYFTGVNMLAYTIYWFLIFFVAKNYEKSIA